MAKKNVPAFGGDDAVEAMLAYLTDVSDEQTGYVDDLEVRFKSLPDDMGWVVSIYSDDTHLCHSAATTIKESLWKAITRLSAALEEAKEAAEADLED